MAIRKHPTKGPGWWILVISNGAKKKQTTYTFEGSEAEARAQEAELRGISHEASGQKFYDVFGRFLDWYHLEVSATTANHCESLLPRIIDTLGNKNIALLRQPDYEHYKRKRLADGVKRKTVNVELGYIRSLLNYAANQLGLPVGELPKLYTKKQTAPPPVTPLSPAESARLLAELHGDKKTIVILYAICALRRNEGLLLQRKHIDLEAGLINVIGKGDKARIVPIIGDELHRRLKVACTHYPKMRRGKQVDSSDKKREKRPDEYLFICARTGKPYRDIKKGIKAAAVRAGISKHVANHLLRHSAATAGILAGLDVRSLQVLVGHSDIRMTERYTHLGGEIMHAAGHKLDALHSDAATAQKQASETYESEPPKKSNIIKLVRK